HVREAESEDSLIFGTPRQQAEVMETGLPGIIVEVLLLRRESGAPEPRQALRVAPRLAPDFLLHGYVDGGVPAHAARERAADVDVPIEQRLVVNVRERIGMVEHADAIGAAQAARFWRDLFDCLPFLLVLLLLCILIVLVDRLIEEDPRLGDEQRA